MFSESLKNSIWLIGDKILKIFLSVAFTYVCARTLTKEDFGIYGYVISLISIFSVIGSMGIQELLSNYFLKEDSDDQLIWVNSFVTILVSVIFSFSFLFFYTILVEHDKYIVEYIFLSSLTIFIRPFEVTQILLDCQLKSSTYIKKINLINMIFSCIRIIALIHTASLQSIMLITVIETFVLIVLHVAITIKIGIKLNINSFKLSFVKNFIPQVFPFLFSALCIMLYVRIDIFFIKEWLGLEQLAYYTAATKLSEVWYIIPMAISTSYFSRLSHTFQNDQVLFACDFTALLKKVFQIAFAVCVLIDIFAGMIISTFYGLEYSNSIGILQIHIWTLIPVFFGVVSSKWFILNNMNHFIFLRALFGLIVNVVLNCIFIPSHGISAAAVSSVVSYFMSDLFFDLFFRQTRPLFKIKLNAMKNLLYFSI